MGLSQETDFVLSIEPCAPAGEQQELNQKNKTGNRSQHTLGLFEEAVLMFFF